MSDAEANSKSQLKRIAVQTGGKAENPPQMDKAYQRVMTPEQAGEIYRRVFGMLHNPIDWKAPIDCIVPFELAGVAHSAIVFMTASTPFSEHLPDGRFRLIAAGYRHGPAGG